MGSEILYIKAKKWISSCFFSSVGLFLILHKVQRGFLNMSFKLHCSVYAWGADFHIYHQESLTLTVTWHELKMTVNIAWNWSTASQTLGDNPGTSICFCVCVSVCVCVCVCVWQDVTASPRTVTQRPLKHMQIQTHANDAALSPLTQEVLFLSATSCPSHLDPNTHTHPPSYI